MFKTVRTRLAGMLGPAANFPSNARGNVAITFAISALPVLAAVGCVVDYTTATMIKTKLQAAADAATLATVSVNSSVITTAKSMTSNGAVSGGPTFANNFFNADVTNTSGYTNLTPTSSINKTGQVITATISFTAQVPTYFMGLAGYKNVTVSGSSTASYTLPTFIDFYLMLDVSGSMSFPSTASEQQRLMAVNPDNLNGSNGYPGGCTFACHFTSQGACGQSPPNNPYQGSIPAPGTSSNPGAGGYCQGFIISRLGTTPVSGFTGNNSKNGNSVNWSNTPVSSCSNPGTTACIQLRADAVGYAVNQLLSTAAASEVVTNQFRVGLFPFIQYLPTSCSTFPPCFPLTTNLTGSPTNSSTINYAAAQLATVLDTGTNAALGSGGTHFENAFPSMNSLIKTVGTGGSATNTLPYVFLITDGSQDNQTQSGGNWSGSNQATTIDATLCTTLKKRGITIAVLYIPYQTIQNPNPNFAGNEDGAANANIANIPGALQSCATTNFYYTANTPQDITDALITMFEQAVSTARITN
jgi:Flp pilus assembly protein TadG